MIPTSTFIHAHAVVDQTVTVGRYCRIWQFASVIRRAIIGEECNIAAGAIVDGAVVGNRTRIGAGAQLHPGTKIRMDVFVGPGVIFCNDRWPMVGKEGFVLEDGRWTVIVESCASIGAGAIVLPGVKIGKGSMVAAGAVVKKDVPNGMLLRHDCSLREIPKNVENRRMRWATE